MKMVASRPTVLPDGAEAGIYPVPDGILELVGT